MGSNQYEATSSSNWRLTLVNAILKGSPGKSEKHKTVIFLGSINILFHVPRNISSIVNEVIRTILFFL